MTELDQAAIDTAEHRGQYLLAKELLTFVEQYDDAIDRGVSLERLEAYADELDERGVQSVSAEQMDQLVEENVTDSETWSGPDAIYEVGDGLSAFPPSWHDELTGEDDLMEYVDVIGGAVASEEEHTATGAAGQGVPRQLLFDVATALGPFSRDSAKEALARLGDEGAIEERASQHPEARVWPAHE